MTDDDINKVALEISMQKSAALKMINLEAQKMSDMVIDGSPVDVLFEKGVDLAARSISECLLIEFDGIIQTMFESFESTGNLNKIIAINAATNVVKGLTERIRNVEKLYGSDVDIDVEE